MITIKIIILILLIPIAILLLKCICSQNECVKFSEYAREKELDPNFEVTEGWIKLCAEMDKKWRGENETN